jgi:ADP-dependent NAD(P)H-hydrate dehydratase / NAD(P)H-hydrate epimerase
MEVVATSEQMRKYDRYAIEKLGIPGIILMENAGKGVVDAIIEKYGSPAGKRFTIVCGKGNNGGDGFVVARHLHRLGAIVKVILLTKAREIKADARVNLDVLLKMDTKGTASHGIKVVEVSSSKAALKFSQCDYIIDAILGTGFTGEVSGLYRRAIEAMNKSNAKRIAIDVPSGLNSDTGLVRKTAIHASLTVTMGLNKLGLTLSKSIDYAGVVKVVDLGVSLDVDIPNKPSTFLVHRDDVKNILPVRPLTTHKYDFKKIYVLAGSRGLTGAAAMTANTALRAGGGLVVLGTPKSIYPILARKLTEIMVDPLEETEEGTIGLGAKNRILEKLDWADIVVVGPGLSKNEETQRIIQDIVSTSGKFLLIDADGLSAIPIGSPVWKTNSKKKVILTPHVGELSRLIDIPSQEIEDNRIEIAREYAKKLNVTLVLKGAPTVTGTSSGNVYINSTGNPGMATAGTGDVLSGIIAGLLAQRMDKDDAAFSGVYLHGFAGDLANEQVGEKSLMAMDLYESLSDAFKKIEM